MKLGFTGTRDQWTSAQENAFERELDRIAESDLVFGLEEFHHGDCWGSDARASNYVWREYTACNVVIHPPANPCLRAFCESDLIREPKPYLVRNLNILREVEHLLATVAGDEVLRSGTWSTIRKAKKLGMPVSIVWPNGSIVQFFGEDE